VVPREREEGESLSDMALNFEQRRVQSMKTIELEALVEAELASAEDGHVHSALGVAAVHELDRRDTEDTRFFVENSYPGAGAVSPSVHTGWARRCLTPPPG
jgi:hypothetical protein